jgi:hypothetical protein
LPFTMDQVREALERHRAGLPSADSPPSPPPVQREAAPGPRDPDRALPFTVAEVRAALEKPHFTQASGPPRSGPAQPPVAGSGPASGQSGPVRRRLISRIEEVTPHDRPARPAGQPAAAAHSESLPQPVEVAPPTPVTLAPPADEATETLPVPLASTEPRAPSTPRSGETGQPEAAAPTEPSKTEAGLTPDSAGAAERLEAAPTGQAPGPVVQRWAETDLPRLTPETAAAQSNREEPPAGPPPLPPAGGPDQPARPATRPSPVALTGSEPAMEAAASPEATASAPGSEVALPTPERAEVEPTPRLQPATEPSLTEPPQLAVEAEAPPLEGTAARVPSQIEEIKPLEATMPLAPSAGPPDPAGRQQQVSEPETPEPPEVSHHPPGPANLAQPGPAPEPVQRRETLPAEPPDRPEEARPEPAGPTAPSGDKTVSPPPPASEPAGATSPDRAEPEPARPPAPIGTTADPAPERAAAETGPTPLPLGQESAGDQDPAQEMPLANVLPPAQTFRPKPGEFDSSSGTATRMKISPSIPPAGGKLAPPPSRGRLGGGLFTRESEVETGSRPQPALQRHHEAELPQPHPPVEDVDDPGLGEPRPLEATMPLAPSAGPPGPAARQKASEADAAGTQGEEPGWPAEDEGLAGAQPAAAERPSRLSTQPDRPQRTAQTRPATPPPAPDPAAGKIMAQTTSIGPLEEESDGRPETFHLAHTPPEERSAGPGRPADTGGSTGDRPRPEPGQADLPLQRRPELTQSQPLTELETGATPAEAQLPGPEAGAAAQTEAGPPPLPQEDPVKTDLTRMTPPAVQREPVADMPLRQPGPAPSPPQGGAPPLLDEPRQLPRPLPPVEPLVSPGEEPVADLPLGQAAGPVPGLPQSEAPPILDEPRQLPRPLLPVEPLVSPRGGEGGEPVRPTAATGLGAEVETGRTIPPAPAGQTRPVQAETLAESPIERPESAPVEPGPAGSGPAALAKGVSEPQARRQRQPELPLARPWSAPQAMTRPDSATTEVDLNQDILSRARSGSSLPLSEPFNNGRQGLGVDRPRPQMAVLPQARREVAAQPDPVAGEVPALSGPRLALQIERPVAPGSDLPLAQARRVEVGPSGYEPTAEPALRARSSAASTTTTVQRQVEPVSPVVTPPEAAVPAGAAFIQRQDTEASPSSEGSATGADQGGVNLDRLARQVLPLLKRLLAVERDRRSHR